MKKFSFIILILHYAFMSTAQAPLITWSKLFGGTSKEQASAIVESLDGKVWAVGSAYSSDSDVSKHYGFTSYSDAWLLTMNKSTGALLKEKNFGGTLDDVATSIVELTDTSHIIFGHTYSVDSDLISPDTLLPYNHGNSDLWLLRVRRDGLILNRTCFGGTDYEFAGKMVKAGANRLYACGKTHSANGNVLGKHAGYDAWLVRFDNKLALLWQKCLGTDGDDNGYAVSATADGGCVVAGSVNAGGGDATGYHSNKDFFVAKLDSTGIILWSRCYGGSGDEEANAVTVNGSGQIVVAGYTNSTDGDVTGLHGTTIDYWVIKLKAVNGDIVWKKCYGGMYGDVATDIETDPAGGYFVSGNITPNTTTPRDYTGTHSYDDAWIIHLKETGALDWQGDYGGDGLESVQDIKVMADGTLCAAAQSASDNDDVSGQHFPPFGPFSDSWILKLGAVGCAIPNGLYADLPISPIVTLHWNPVSGVKNYKLMIKPSGGVFTTYSIADPATSKTLTLSSATTYKWKLQTVCKSGSSAFTALKTFSTPARLSEALMESENGELILFPNPASGLLNIEMKNGKELQRVQIMNAMGQVIIHHDDLHALSHVLDVSSLDAGWYVALVTFDDQVAMKKFLKQ